MLFRSSFYACRNQRSRRLICGQGCIKPPSTIRHSAGLNDYSEHSPAPRISTAYAQTTTIAQYRRTELAGRTPGLPGLTRWFLDFDEKVCPSRGIWQNKPAMVCNGLRLYTQCFANRTRSLSLRAFAVVSSVQYQIAVSDCHTGFQDHHFTSINIESGRSVAW